MLQNFKHSSAKKNELLEMQSGHALLRKVGKVINYLRVL